MIKGACTCETTIELTAVIVGLKTANKGNMSDIFNA